MPAFCFECDFLDGSSSVNPTLLPEWTSRDLPTPDASPLRRHHVQPVPNLLLGVAGLLGIECGSLLPVVRVLLLSTFR